MKKIPFIYIMMLFISCGNKDETSKPTVDINIKKKNHQIVKKEFQSMLDSADLAGSILILDPIKKIFYSNDFEWAHTGKLPASTFKIPNTIIGLETGIIENEKTLFKWNGEKRASKYWEQDLTIKDAFQLSCVPCYQEIARKIGTNQMRTKIEYINYGSMVFDSTTIDQFWLKGNSSITQFEQIDFLQRFYNSSLPISPRTENIMKSLFVIDKNEAYRISGKTGWSINDQINNGWFVGYIELSQDVYYFATNIEPKKNFDMKLFPPLRKEITYKALQLLKIKQ